jgi:hypothetical protein
MYFCVGKWEFLGREESIAMKVRYFLSLFAILLFALAAVAQTDRGTITGRITDASGGVIPQVQVTATNLDTKVVYPGTSNQLGLYSVGELPIGKYAVEMKREGFKTYKQEGVTISIGQVVRLDVTLGVGAVTQSVTVNADAVILQTEQATVGTNMKASDMETLPLSIAGGRDISTFAFTVVPTVAGNDWASSIAGSQTLSKAISVDGVSDDGGMMGTQHPPGMEAIQQFEVQTVVGADAQATGGGAFLYTLKSGTNQFHGSAFGFLENEVLNANNWDNNNLGIARPRDRFSDWGFSLGGPVYIPKLYNGKNKTFVFGAYERYNQTNLAFLDNQNTVPTPDMLQGNFSALLGSPICSDGNPGPCTNGATPLTIQNDAGATVPLLQGMIFDPATQNVFTGNIIPSNMISKQSQKLMSLWQSDYAPMNSNTAYNYSIIADSVPITIRTTTDIKVDQNFGEKNHLSGSIDIFHNPVTDCGGVLTSTGPCWGLWKNGSSNPGPLSDQSAISNITQKSIRVIDNHIFTPTLFNTLSYAYNNYRETTVTGDPVNNQALGFPVPGGPAKNNLPYIQFGSVQTTAVNGGWGWEAGIGDEFGSTYGYSQTHIRDNVSWLKGRHSVKFGGEFIAYRPENGPGSEYYLYNFTSATGVPTALENNGSIAQQLGFGYANFELGDVASGQQPNPGGFGAPARRTGVSFTFSDSIKLAPKLTLNVGLRWDYYGRLHETQGIWTNFDLNGSNPSWPGLPGAYEYASSGQDSWETNENYTNFQPYAGVAYQMKPKLVVRASFGLMNEPLGLNQWGGIPYNTNAQAQAGYGGTNNIVSGAPNAVAFQWDQNIYPGVKIPASHDPTQNRIYPYNTVTIDPNVLHLGRIYNWTMGVQYELGKDAMLDINYVGNQGTRLNNGGLDPVNYPTWANYYPLLMSGHAGDWITTQAQAQAAGVPWYPFITTETGAYGGYTGAGAVAPYPQFMGIGDAPLCIAGSPLGSSAYRALVVEFKKRTSHGLTADLNYTYQDATTNTDSTITNQNGGNMYEGWVNSSSFQDPYAYNSATDRANVMQGIPQHEVKGYMVYNLPIGKGKRFLSNGRAANYALGGWQLGLMVHYTSGLPLHAVDSQFGYPGWSPIYAVRANGALPNTFQRLDLANPTDPSNLMYSPNLFTNPALGQFGNQQEYSYAFTGFAHYNEDASLLKTFGFGADNRYRVSLRLEMFDVFNRHQLNDPNEGNVGSTTLGMVGGVAPYHRNGQVGARFEW